MFQKNSKKPYFGDILGPFFPKFGQKWIFLEKRALSGFSYSKYLQLCQKSEKTIDLFQRKTPNWQTRR